MTTKLACQHIMCPIQQGNWCEKCGKLMKESDRLIFSTIRGERHQA